MKRNKKYWLAIGAAVGIYVVISGLTFGCPFRYLLGISCPGCGMSRSWLSLLKGDIGGAFFYHPLFFTVPLLFYSIYRCEEKNDFFGKSLLALIVGLFFLVWFFRLFSGHPVTAPHLAQGLIFRVKNTIQNMLGVLYCL